ncbi:MAG: hypothetical protein NC911_00030 [Candidatus Omnitrophica bacterium]|nr:hypothetical protein [Candidatus Omnitrophota bacterium]
MDRKIFLLVAASLFFGFGCLVSGDTVVNEPFGNDGEGFSIIGRCGQVKGGLEIILVKEKKIDVRLSLQATDLVELNHHYATSKLPEGLRDAGISVSLNGNHGWSRSTIRFVYFIRPDIHFYTKEDFDLAVKKWEEFPPASSHQFRLSLVRKSNRVEVWLDGQYVISFFWNGWQEMKLVSVNGGEVKQVSPVNDSETQKYLPLDLSHHKQKGQTKIVSISVAPGEKKISGIPFQIVSRENYLDTGYARLFTKFDDYYPPYYRRSAWDGLPESIIRKVPKRYYNYLHLLCAVDESKSAELGIRIARYRQAWDGSGATQADVNTKIEPKNPVNCVLKKIGEIKIEGGKTWPLYLAEIPLATGELADYLTREGMDWNEVSDFFYLEFTRKIETLVTMNNSRFERLPLGPQSGVLIFAATLEKSPAEIFVGSEETSNVFYRNNHPKLIVRLKNDLPEDLSLSLDGRLTDFWGTERKIRQTVQVKAREKQEVLLGLENLDPGWYAAEFSFFDPGKRVVWKQPFTLALLPPDTRKATWRDQPHFGIWWFRGAHYCEPQADRVLPLVQKLGFRHVSPQQPASQYGCTAENFARYQVTPSMMSSIRSGDPVTIEKKVKEFVDSWPETKYGMIFHETGGLGHGIELPPEILGKKAPVLEEKYQERRNQLLEHIKLHAGIIRKVAPEMKIILGNGATNFNVHWLREKLPLEYWDMLGMEMAVQLFSPEGQPTGFNLQSFYIANKMKQIYGYENLPVTSCYELDYRATGPGGLSLKRQADWYARDVLHMLAYQVPNINVGLLMDVNSGYYGSRWGSTGVCFRSPFMMPKPSFVSLATLTRVLDLAKYQKYLDTGSHSLYCLEFKKDNCYVYSFWCTRGTYETEIKFSSGSGSYQLVDSMGRETAANYAGSLATFLVTESPCYLITESQLLSAKGKTPYHSRPRWKFSSVIAQMSPTEKWQTGEETNEALEKCGAYSPKAKGKFLLEKSSASTLRLTLQPDPRIPDLVSQYTFLKPEKGPIGIPGKPEIIGLWVKGNAGWGRIVFELVDGEGKVWSSFKDEGGWELSDWEDDTRISFDGWRFISVRLPYRYGSGQPSPAYRDWNRDDELVYPLKLQGIYVLMREKLVYLTELVPAKSLSLELKDLTVGSFSD